MRCHVSCGRGARLTSTHSVTQLCSRITGTRGRHDNRHMPEPHPVMSHHSCPQRMLRCSMRAFLDSAALLCRFSKSKRTVLHSSSRESRHSQVIHAHALSPYIPRSDLYCTCQARAYVPRVHATKRTVRSSASSSLRSAAAPSVSTGTTPLRLAAEAADAGVRGTLLLHITVPSSASPASTIPRRPTPTTSTADSAPAGSNDLTSCSGAVSPPDATPVAPVATGAQSAPVPEPAGGRLRGDARGDRGDVSPVHELTHLTLHLVSAAIDRGDRISAEALPLAWAPRPAAAAAPTLPPLPSAGIGTTASPASNAEGMTLEGRESCSVGPLPGWVLSAAATAPAGPHSHASTRSAGVRGPGPADSTRLTAAASTAPIVWLYFCDLRGAPEFSHDDADAGIAAVEHELLQDSCRVPSGA